MTVMRVAVVLGMCVALTGCAFPVSTQPESGGTWPKSTTAVPSPTPFVAESASPAPQQGAAEDPQVVAWPAGSESVLTDDGMGPLVLGSLLPTSDPRGALSECGAVAGVPPNVAVGLLDDGTVVKVSAWAPLGDAGEVEVSTSRGIGLGASAEEVLDAYGPDAEYREVVLRGASGDEVEYRVDVDLADSMLVFTFDIRDAGEPAPSPESLVVEQMRLALPGHGDSPWYCA